MNGKRQKTHSSVALEPAGEGEAFSGSSARAEPSAAKPTPESPASAEQLMEEVCSRENLETAWKRVRRNKGSAGVDGMTIDAAKDYLREQWQISGLNCSAEPTSRCRSNGSKYPSRMAGSESSACLASSTG